MRGYPTPRCVCVNAVDKGVSGRFGAKAVDEGLTALDEDGVWADGCGSEIKGERKWTVGGSWGNGMLTGEVRRAARRGIGARASR